MTRALTLGGEAVLAALFLAAAVALFVPLALVCLALIAGGRWQDRPQPTPLNRTWRD